MNYLIYLGTTIVLILFPYVIQPRIEKIWPDTKLPINVMAIAVAAALALAGTIQAIADGFLPVSAYFVILGILIGILLYYGITHRKEVSQRMRRAYYQGLIGYTYVFSITGVLMFWSAPFFPNIVL